MAESLVCCSLRANTPTHFSRALFNRPFISTPPLAYALVRVAKCSHSQRPRVSRTMFQVDEDNCRRGLVVVRGPGWEWGDQDGSIGGVGVVLRKFYVENPFSDVCFENVEGKVDWDVEVPAPAPRQITEENTPEGGGG
eukprot:2424609-Rhodomonas_salina.1